MDPESQRQLSSLGLLRGFGSSIWFITCFEVPGAALECKLRQLRFRTSPCHGFCQLCIFKREPPSPPHLVSFLSAGWLYVASRRHCEIKMRFCVRHSENVHVL